MSHALSLPVLVSNCGLSLFFISVYLNTVFRSKIKWPCVVCAARVKLIQFGTRCFCFVFLPYMWWRRRSLVSTNSLTMQQLMLHTLDVMGSGQHLFCVFVSFHRRTETLSSYSVYHRSRILYFTRVGFYHFWGKKKKLKSLGKRWCLRYVKWEQTTSCQYLFLPQLAWQLATCTGSKVKLC